MMMEIIQPGAIRGLPERELDMLQRLVSVYDYHKASNEKKRKYYEGKVLLDDVNLGIALPDGLKNLEIGCNWGAKCVDVLAARSMFDGFVNEYGELDETMARIVNGNRLIPEYMKACRDELQLGATFATLSADPDLGAKIRFHSEYTAAALWDGERGRLECGLAIIDTAPDEAEATSWSPSRLNLYTDEAIWEIWRDEDGTWFAEEHRHIMGRPLMVPMVWNPTSDKPFGRSRIKEPIRRLIDGYVRTIANATIGLEFSTAPQKYLLGVTDEQYDAVIDNKFKQYVGNLLAATTNPETGQNPTFGQLPQGTIGPHVEMIRILATQFSAATGLTVTDTGVVSEANPSSADAVLAQTQTLVGMAEELNAGNSAALQTIAQMAMAIAGNVKMEDLDDAQKSVVPHFKNPALPSVAATTDAAVKIASARQGFSQTDVFLEMIGFGPADIRRIRAQEERAQGAAVLEGMGL